MTRRVVFSKGTEHEQQAGERGRGGGDECQPRVNGKRWIGRLEGFSFRGTFLTKGFDVDTYKEQCLRTKRNGSLESADLIGKIRRLFSRLACQGISGSRTARANPAARIDVAIIIYVRMFSVLESSVTDKRCLPCSRDPGLPLSSVFVVGIVFE